MRKLIATFLWGVTFFAIASSNDEMGRLAEMSETLQKRSIEEFMATARANRWEAPRIPSQWFVDSKVTDDEEKRLSQAARDFGYQLALRLEDLAQEQWSLRSRDALFQRSLLLCDLGDWCAGTVGYGNIFLARKCLDLAAVGAKRLTVSLDFPLALCERLAARMNPKWLDMSYRLQVLNGEAGATIFINANVTPEQLDGQWAIGWSLRRMAEDPALVKKYALLTQPPPPDPALVNVKMFTSNLRFFVSPEVPQDPVTLPRSWDCRQHRLMIGWELGLRSCAEAVSLLNYRSAVGFFPPPFVRSEEETRQIDAVIAEYAKKGISVGKMEDDPLHDPLREAFRREWMKRAPKAERLGNDYLIAARVYKQVSDKSSFDED